MDEAFLLAQGTWGDSIVEFIRIGDARREDLINSANGVETYLSAQP